MSATPSPKTDHLQEWLAREREVHAAVDAGPGPGVVSPEQARTMSGLEVMRAMMTGELPVPTIGPTLAMTLVEVSEGHAVFQGAPGPNHLNPLGSVHGGWYATILDSAMGCAVHSMLKPGQGFSTTNLSVNLVRAIPSNVQRVRAVGRVLHFGRQLASIEADLVGPDGTIYAHGVSTGLVFELRK